MHAIGRWEVAVAQTVTSARRWPVQAEAAGRSRADARDGGLRSRQFYLIVAAAFAVVTYLAVELVLFAGVAMYLAANPSTARSEVGTWIAHASSLIAWVGACM